jgi:signal transduction histidine kinase
MIPAMPRTTSVRGDRAATGLWIGCLVIAAAGTALTVLVLPDLEPSDALTSLLTPVAAAVFATLGWLIVRRAGNPIGWIMLAVGAFTGFMQVGSSYAIIGMLTRPGALPAAKWIGAVSEWTFVPIVLTLAFTFLLFPDGHLPSPRWRLVAVLCVVASVVTLLAFVVTPRLVLLPAPGGVSLSYPNPFALASIGGLSAIGSAVNSGQTVLSIALFALALAALVVRYRRGGTVVRLQISWVALAVAAAVITQVVAFIALAACRCLLQESPVATVSFLMTGLVALLGLPVVITIAILRYRLFEVEVVINRAVVYGALAAAVTLIYVTVVVGIGTLVGYSGGPFLTIAAAAVIAFVFQPLRRRAQRLANRVVYGDRSTPYQVLSEFAEQMAGAIDLDEVLERMVSALAAGTGATRVDVWLRVGEELRAAATWPKDSPPAEPVPLGAAERAEAFDGATRAASVRYGGELLGALAIAKPRNEPLTPTEDRLLEDLASQAGLVFREARLTAELEATVVELRASRRRLVEAQDGERRRLERNLHDGAQQQLVALSVQLGLLERVADDPERVRRSAQMLGEAVRDAIDDLRDLARGIYPPLLADKGLGAALEAQARRAAVPTTVDSDGVGRYPQEIEAAVYFCTLEALQNVAKYAHAVAASIRLAESNGHLVFEIRDDGTGFDPAATGYGSGLRGMADRIDAIGGRLEVLSQPGRGTVVRGTIGLS